jgi:hypothetical protein
MSIEADAFNKAEAKALTGPNITDVISAKEMFGGKDARLDGISEKIEPFMALVENARKFASMSDTGEFSGFLEHCREQAQKGEPLYRLMMGMPIA